MDPDPPDHEDDFERALEDCVRSLELVAAPTKLAAARERLPRDQPQRALDEGLAALLDALEAGTSRIEPDEGPHAALVPLLRRVHAAVLRWPFATAPEPLLVDLAAAALAALQLLHSSPESAPADTLE